VVVLMVILTTLGPPIVLSRLLGPSDAAPGDGTTKV
jgi:hypothetical protein